MLEKRLVTQEDLARWVGSDTYRQLVEFVAALQALVEGKPNDAAVAASPAVAVVVAVLDAVETEIDAHPVAACELRFGKPEFRGFYDAVERRVPPMLASLAAPDACDYLLALFGDRTRIDYGSGHELSFVAFLFCLERAGVLAEAERAAVVLRVFTRYMAVMRRLQRTYWLEPAGLHGVWGLDDYHFLPFLFGALQLATHPHMRPKLIHNRELVEQYYPQYMYLECIHFINSVKTEGLSLRWHLPMLDDILAAKLWRKIQQGMVKMYANEVLGKLPIMQHFQFGEVLVCPAGVPPAGARGAGGAGGAGGADCGHAHVNTWGDCCGIKVPSAFAAAAKPLPFD